MKSGTVRLSVEQNRENTYFINDKWISDLAKGLHKLFSVFEGIQEPFILSLACKSVVLKTWYCPLCIARCDLLAAIFVMLKILRLLFVARIELFNNNGRLAPVKTKTTTEARKA